VSDDRPKSNSRIVAGTYETARLVKIPKVPSSTPVAESLPTPSESVMTGLDRRLLSSNPCPVLRPMPRPLLTRDEIHSSDRHPLARQLGRWRTRTPISDEIAKDVDVRGRVAVPTSSAGSDRSAGKTIVVNPEVNGSPLVDGAGQAPAPKRAPGAGPPALPPGPPNPIRFIDALGPAAPSFGPIYSKTKLLPGVITVSIDDIDSIPVAFGQSSKLTYTVGIARVPGPSIRVQVVVTLVALASGTQKTIASTLVDLSWAAPPHTEKRDVSWIAVGLHLVMVTVTPADNSDKSVLARDVQYVLVNTPAPDNTNISNLPDCTPDVVVEAFLGDASKDFGDGAEAAIRSLFLGLNIGEFHRSLLPTDDRPFFRIGFNMDPSDRNEFLKREECMQTESFSAPRGGVSFIAKADFLNRLAQFAFEGLDPSRLTFAASTPIGDIRFYVTSVKLLGIEELDGSIDSARKILDDWALDDIVPAGWLGQFLTPDSVAIITQLSGYTTVGESFSLTVYDIVFPICTTPTITVVPPPPPFLPPIPGIGGVMPLQTPAPADPLTAFDLSISTIEVGRTGLIQRVFNSSHFAGIGRTIVSLLNALNHYGSGIGPFDKRVVRYETIEVAPLTDGSGGSALALRADVLPGEPRIALVRIAPEIQAFDSYTSNESGASFVWSVIEQSFNLPTGATVDERKFIADAVDMYNPTFQWTVVGGDVDLPGWRVETHDGGTQQSVTIRVVATDVQWPLVAPPEGYPIFSDTITLFFHAQATDSPPGYFTKQGALTVSINFLPAAQARIVQAYNR
jgi:hypothetical protein